MTEIQNGEARGVYAYMVASAIRSSDGELITAVKLWHDEDEEPVLYGLFPEQAMALAIQIGALAARQLGTIEHDWETEEA